jgi:hypothetical protein
MAYVAEDAIAGPKGIAGWLILPVIGTLVSPLTTGYAAFQNVAVFVNGSSLSTVLAVFIFVEFLFNFSLMAAWIFAAIMLFRHKRLYPRLFVALVVITLIGAVLDLAVAALAFDVAIDGKDVAGVVQAVFHLAIWGPYMYMSKRIKNTFVVD